MAKKKSSSSSSSAARKSTAAKTPSSTGKAPTRNTASSPSHPAPPPAGDLLAEKAAETQVLAESVPFNSNKPTEFGRENAVAPSAGFTVEPPSPVVGSSTVSESNGSDKTGTGDAIEGMNLATGSLDRVRVDNTGRALTTNQGVAVADNQNSLKAGLRGPTLLEDFILREKIT
ncbi:MAG: katE, partial [Gemmatimonadetes bacterium]|nr:katE [Gemmatimonadota bacterium]